MMMMAQVDGSEEPVGLPFYQRRSLYRHVRSSEDNCRKTRTRPAIRQVVRALRMERQVKHTGKDTIRQMIEKCHFVILSFVIYTFIVVKLLTII